MTITPKDAEALTPPADLAERVSAAQSKIGGE